MSTEELERTTPVKPPTVNRKMKPTAQSKGVSHRSVAPCKVANHLKTLTPVGIAIIIVAAVK